MKYFGYGEYLTPDEQAEMKAKKMDRLWMYIRGMKEKEVES